MKITAVRSYILSTSMPKPLCLGNYVIEKVYATIVEIMTDEGISGVGEAIARLGPCATKSIIDDMLGPCIIGSDPMEIEQLWERMFNLMRFRGHSRGYFMEAISGVDIALWDVTGKVLGLPVHRLMMGCNRPEVPVYASSVFWDSPAIMAATAADLVEKGYLPVKVKVGQGVEADYKCLEAIRQTAGTKIQLMVDANGAYNCIDAIRLGRKLEQIDVCWFEEPIPPDDLDGYRTLSKKLDIPIASGECEFSIYGMRNLIESGIQIIQPDVTRAGGITGVHKMVTLAQAFHVPYSPHIGFGSSVCMDASLHLAAAVPNFMIAEYMVVDNPLVDSLLVEPIPIPKNGMIEIPHGPGLGIEINREALEKYRIS